MGIYNRTAFFLRLLKERITGGSAPLVVVLNITFKCNLKCGYCYGQFYKQGHKRDFTTNELKNLIDNLASLGTRSITLGGGEPLLREDIGEIIKHIKSKGIECGMNTNGTLIPKRIDALRSIDMVTVSIDGPKEQNDANRGEGSFEKIIKGIDIALEKGLKVHTTTVITKHNVNCIDWIVNFAKERGIQAEFNFLFNQSNDKDDSDKFMSEDGVLKKAAESIVEHKLRGAPILFSSDVYKYVANWPELKKRVYYNETPNFDFIKCYAGRFMFFINSDGMVYPCVQLIDIFNAKNFKEVEIKEALDNCLNNPCKACYFPCFNEFNLIMDLNPKIITNQVISTLKKQ